MFDRVVPIAKYFELVEYRQFGTATPLAVLMLASNAALTVCSGVYVMFLFRIYCLSYELRILVVRITSAGTCCPFIT